MQTYDFVTDLSSVGRASDCNGNLGHLNVACSNQAGRIIYRNLLPHLLPRFCRKADFYDGPRRTGTGLTSRTLVVIRMV